MKEYGFEIPRPFQTLQEFTEWGWSTETPGKGTEMRYRNVTQPGANATIQCPYSAYGVFLMHYSWRSFEEFKAHRSQTPVKSDGAYDNRAVDDPHGAWMDGLINHPCSGAYFNDFTAPMAKKTREHMAARVARWNGARSAQQLAKLNDNYEAWIQEAECGTGSKEYDGAFPPVDDWVI